MTTNDQNIPAHDQQHTLCSVRKAGRMGSLLRSLAGTPAGWQPTRRGSFLVLVVGTLALLAVMAIIYSSIGNHDVRMNAALAKNDRLSEAPEQIKDYILAVIGDSVTATGYDTKDSMPRDEPVLLSRVTADFPSTSYSASSTITTLSGNAIPFSPTGSVTGFLATPDFSQRPASQMPQTWRPTTPWLADSEPTFLNFQQTPVTPQNRHWYKRDWAHISNIAPDGRFINRHNLRNNFDAEPGFLAAGLNGRPQTSYRVNQVFDATSGTLVNTTDFGQTINATNPLPAHLDSRQAWMFRPARASGNNGPDSPSYEPYLFADADGDGMFDSRWMELIDARSGVLKNYLNVDPKFRYVMAVRITDLSGNINLNTATDSKTEAGAGYERGPRAIEPAGLSPASVDLHRLLTGQVPFEMAGAAAGVGMDGMYQGAANAPADYSQMNQEASFEVGEDAYTALRLRLATGVTPPSGDFAYTDTNLVPTFTSEYSLTTSDFDFSATPEKRWEYYNLTSRAIQSAAYYKTPSANETRFHGDFGTDDLLELVARRAVNDPNVTSSLELTLGGRSIPEVGGVGTRPNRHSPLRSNRGLDTELERYDWPPPNGYTAGVPFDRTMLFFNNDLRSRLTTVSGARQFRQLPSYVSPTGRTVNPYALSTDELRVDPKLYLSTIKAIDQLTATPTAAQQSQRHTATNAIFKTFVDALAPRLGVGEPWAENGALGGPRATEFYGYRGPELALRVAAHMTVNLIDAYDQRTGMELPTVHTLLLDGDFASTIAGFAATSPEGRAFGPWKDYTPPTPTNPQDQKYRALQLPDQLLGSGAAGSTVYAPAINVFGIESQPFITQAASFTVYADAYRAAGGDDESSSTFATIQPDITFGPGNPDLMYRAVAFQLHNPFNTAVTLGGQITPESKFYNVADPRFPRLDVEQSYFYINFNGKTFKLAALDEQVYVTTPEAQQRHQNNEPALDAGDADVILNATPGMPTPRADSIYIPKTDTFNLEPITLSPITIKPGETIVVYALSDTPKSIMERMSKLNSTGAGQLLDTSPAGTSRKYKEFRNVILDAIQGNMGDITPGTKVYWIPEMLTTGPDAGLAVIPSHTSANDYVADTTGGGSATVELWRALRSGDDAQTNTLRTLPTRYWAPGPGPRPGGPAVVAFVPNRVENDQLVDRFVIKHMDEFDAKLPTTSLQYQIDNSDYQDDAKLFMLTKWACVARKGNPGGKAPHGALPAYCIEPKYASDWNQHKVDSVDPPFDEADFVSVSSGFEGASDTVAAWMVNMKSVAIQDNYIAKGPDDLGTPFPPANATPGGSAAYESRYPEIAIFDNDMKVKIPLPPPPAPAPNPAERVLLRPADLLLPLGIGPEEMPVKAGGVLVTDMNERWTTLGEAMALALGYQTGTPLADDSMSNPKVYGIPANTPEIYWPLDRGNVRLDSFAPFIDANNDGVFDPTTEIRVGLQIPLALNILDAFTTNPLDDFITNPAKPEDAKWETLKRATPGTVNINTASLMTLEAGFPMLSPPPYNDPTLAAKPLWWWGTSAAWGPHDERADIATSVVAYRDKLEILPRASTVATGALPPPGTITFNVDNNSGGPERPDWADDQLTGRFYASNISAIHEYAGFRSIGELLAVKFQPPTVAATLPTSMDYLGRDTNASSPGWTPTGTFTYPAGASGRIGVDSFGYANPGGGAAPKVPSNIVNSYKEQLAIINSVLPSVSTRSDYFCVWFLVHGYQKSDCEGLGVNDPLVPSVARRFVMVVDRSKVTKKGELPEVLLFKEVPVDPARRD